jgi:F-type H+-transporting ATPase subunit a
MATNPMQQFEVHRIGPSLSFNGVDLSFTNSSLFMLISSILIIIFFIAGTSRVNIVPGKIQLLNELVFNFISKMINETVGPNARPYFPFILTIFLFILTLNMVGLLPYAFTVTSQIIITFFLAVVIFIGVTIVGFAKNGIGFLKIFAPSGVPIFLFPIIVAIEIISFLSRPVSLSVRLFANMLAGHTMLKVFGGFVVSSRYCWRMASFKLFCCFNSTRNIGSFFTSLCICSFIVYLFK